MTYSVGDKVRIHVPVQNLTYQQATSEAEIIDIRDTPPGFYNPYGVVLEKDLPWNGDSLNVWWIEPGEIIEKIG